MGSSGRLPSKVEVSKRPFGGVWDRLRRCLLRFPREPFPGNLDIGQVYDPVPPIQTSTTYPRRGKIWLVEFDQASCHEIQKARLAVIIQNDIGNRYNPVTIVAAVTSKLSPTQ
jgi:hypothetical protein